MLEIIGSFVAVIIVVFFILFTVNLIIEWRGLSRSQKTNRYFSDLVVQWFWTLTVFLLIVLGISDLFK